MQNLLAVLKMSTALPEGEVPTWSLTPGGMPEEKWGWPEGGHRAGCDCECVPQRKEVTEQESPEQQHV